MSSLCVVHQQSGNNMELTGYQDDGDEKSPGYNMKCGFKDGSSKFCSLHQTWHSTKRNN